MGEARCENVVVGAENAWEVENRESGDFQTWGKWLIIFVADNEKFFGGRLEPRMNVDERGCLWLVVCAGAGEIGRGMLVSHLRPVSGGAGQKTRQPVQPVVSEFGLDAEGLFGGARGG